ncbi:MAG TPA: hypothetical protein VFV75_11925 [Candidatus Polarisedimenticolaceae bacterium]|nr:hypothetical protein [Candidatus Polarisedimenticolaceae bacterium]
MRGVSGLISIAVLLCSVAVAADEPHLWAAAELGYGEVALDLDRPTGGSGGRFSTAFKLGAVVHPTFRGGLMLGGWLLDSGDVNDPSRGAGVGQAFLVAQVHPVRRREIFVLLGGGYLSYWDNAPGASGCHGWGATAGMGWEFAVSQHLAVYPVLSYDRGDLGGTLPDRSMNAWTLRAGIARR